MQSSRIYDRTFGTQARCRHRNITISHWKMPVPARSSCAPAISKLEEQPAVRTIETRMDKIENMKTQLAAAKIKRPAEHLPRNEYIHPGATCSSPRYKPASPSRHPMVPERWTTATNWEGILENRTVTMTHSIARMREQLLKLIASCAGLTRLPRDGRLRKPTAPATGQHRLHLVPAWATATRTSTMIYPSSSPAVAPLVFRQANTSTATAAPLANLWLTHLHALGIDYRYADSTGKIAGFKPDQPAPLTAPACTGSFLP